MEREPNSLLEMAQTPSGKAGMFKKRDVSGWKVFRPVFEEKACINCLLCWIFCPHGAVERSLIDSKIKFNLDNCKGCGICANVCPKEAIKMVR